MSGLTWRSYRNKSLTDTLRASQLHLGKSREVTREQHAKGEASARGGKERESRKNHATCKKQDLRARLLDWLQVLYRSFSVFGANPNNIILADSSAPVSSVLSDTAWNFLVKIDSKFILHVTQSVNLID